MNRILPLAFMALAFAVDQVSGASSTLLIYDTLSKPFSLVNEVAPIQLCLTRFDTRVETLADSKVTAADLEKANFIVLAGISGFPQFKSDLQTALERSQKPVMGVGAAASFASEKTRPPRKASAPVEKARLSYRGREWTLRIDPFFGESHAGAHPLLGTSSKGTPPLAWRFGNRFAFAALPSEAPLSMLFSDVLIDFYGGGQESPPAMVFVIQDFNPSCSPATLRRAVDYFEHGKTPFIVTTQMKEVPPGVEITPREDFLDALRYAQAHGGRIFLHGGNGPERSEGFRREGIRIEGGEDTPLASAGLEIGSPLVQRIPGEPPVPFATAVPLRLEGGGRLIPANVHAGMDGSANEELKKSIRDITSFRGGLAVVVIPAWMRFQDMLAAWEAARATDLPVIDPVTRFSIPRS